MSISYQSNNLSKPLVAPLAHFDRGSILLAGGKGINLVELIRAGLSVPAGFVITTAAYELLIKGNGMEANMRELLDSRQIEDPASLTVMSQKMQSLFQAASIPDPSRGEILKAYQELESATVAVRSSATAEDLPEAAFAGQQETLLNVIGEQALLDAVRACWVSLWSERAILYRARQNVDQNSVRMAVVVQQMVQADIAGVMFTANPVSGARDELVIDANPGLGETVVGGLVTPDHFVVDKRSLRVKEQRLGKREVIIRSKAGGGIERITPTDTTIEPTLSPLAVRSLTKLGKRIEHHFGVPQDIEWAWMGDGTEAGHVWILQARPMTALPEPLRVTGPMRIVIPMLAEMWQVRPYPLDVTTFTGTLERAVGSFLAQMIGRSAPNPDKAFLEEDGVVVRFEPPDVRFSPSMLVMPWLTLWRTRHYNPSQWEIDPIIADVLATARELEKRDLAALTWEENIDTLHRSLELIPRVMQLRGRYLPKALVGLGTLWILLKLAGHKDRLGQLISGVETKTTETNRALETLATQIRSDSTLRQIFADREPKDLQSSLQESSVGQEFLRSFSVFLMQYGHRETALTISQPSWKDQPELVLEILKALVRSELGETNRYLEWKRTRDDLLETSILGRWPLHNFFLRSLSHARSLFQIREDTHFYTTLAQPLVRRVVLELSHRLDQVGALDGITDIFHLRLEELEELSGSWPPSPETVTHIQKLVEQRRAKRDLLANTPMVDPRLLAPRSPGSMDKDVVLSGSPGSPGLASGPARIVNDVSDFGKLQPGEVLVAPATNPAWTPLFQRAAAVVVDTGGSASHAAIVAREYGIPAVMGTFDGTKKLTDGQWIQVDGSRGLVLKAEVNDAGIS